MKDFKDGDLVKLNRLYPHSAIWDARSNEEACSIVVGEMMPSDLGLVMATLERGNDSSKIVIVCKHTLGWVWSHKIEVVG